MQESSSRRKQYALRMACCGINTITTLPNRLTSDVAPETNIHTPKQLEHQAEERLVFHASDCIASIMRT